jgi:multiple sugar transport system permease protein
MKTGSASDGYVTLLDCVKNTILVGTLTTIGTVCTTVLSAFAFSRLEFKGRELLFSILLATMMIPGEMMIITNFETVATLDWLDTYQALIIPFCASVFYTFFLRQTFLQIPNELYYAAKVDGKSDFGYLFKVMIPIARPTIISITILSMIGSWNAYIWPRTVSANKKLVTDGIMSLFQSMEGGESSHIVMAAATVVAIPLLIAFICFKKYIMRGVGRSGIKG